MFLGRKGVSQKNRTSNCGKKTLYNGLYWPERAPLTIQARIIIRRREAFVDSPFEIKTK